MANNDSGPKGYAVFFNDVTDNAETGDVENWAVGTIAWDDTLKQHYVCTGVGWQFISAQA